MNEVITIQVEESHCVCKVWEMGSDVREDGTSGDADQWRFRGCIELQETLTTSQRTEREREREFQVCSCWSHLSPLICGQEQVGPALVPGSGSGSVPQELNLDLTD